jgi:hypothetical protein
MIIFIEDDEEEDEYEEVSVSHKSRQRLLCLSEGQEPLRFRRDTQAREVREIYQETCVLRRTQAEIYTM